MARACGRRRFEASSGRNFSIPTRPRAQLRVSLGGISWVEGTHQHKPRADTEDHSILLKTDTARARGQPTNQSAADTTPRHPIRKQDTRARARSDHRLARSRGQEEPKSRRRPAPRCRLSRPRPTDQHRWHSHALASRYELQTSRDNDLAGRDPRHTRAPSPPPLLHQRSIQHTHADRHSTTI